ncbi:uncharacterized [Tachysurus ichikawai]
MYDICRDPSQASASRFLTVILCRIGEEFNLLPIEEAVWVEALSSVTACTSGNEKKTESGAMFCAMMKNRMDFRLKTLLTSGFSSTMETHCCSQR